MLILSNETSPLRNRKAFTLLEVIVAIAIIAISLTTLFSAQSGSISLATEAKFNTNASLLAGLKLAELESGKIEATDSQGDFGEDFPGYTWKLEEQTVSVNVPDLSEIIDKNLRCIDISIFWQEDAYAYTVRYYMRKKDLQ